MNAHPPRACCIVLLTLALGFMPAYGGGPLVVGGPGYGHEGQPFVWNGAMHYRVDGGAMAQTPTGTVKVNNSTGVSRVQQMFQVWQDVPTATITFVNDGAIRSTGAFQDGDVNTVAEYDAVKGSADSGTQTPVIFDANGNLLDQLGLPPEVIGLTDIRRVDTTNGYIQTGMVVLNGRFQDGVSGTDNYEMTSAEFDEVFVHEFGHLIGLDHSQINLDVLYSSSNCTTDMMAGLPVMFPYAVCSAKSSLGLPTLAPDDVAWVSKLYPAPTFATSYGTISGYVLFYDGISHAQGVNVIARRVDDTGTPQNESLRVAFSAVSGLYFTGNPGQPVTGHNTGGDRTGSRDPLLIGYYEIPVLPGTYTVQVQSVDYHFTYGSGVGPLANPIPMPGMPEYWDQGESNHDDTSASSTIAVSAGQTVANIDFILNTNYDRFDQYEGASQSGSAALWPVQRRRQAGVPWAD